MNLFERPAAGVVGAAVCAAWLGLAASALAQIQITLPVTRSVFQRDNGNRATVTVAGNVSQLVDRIEARVQARQGGSSTDWQTIQVSPSGGVFRGTVDLNGGWYNLEVRGIYQNNQVGNVATLERVGVGEVFVIAGQSNAQGLEPLQPGQPESGDDRVNVLKYFNGGNSPGDPPRPEFEHLFNGWYGLHAFGSWCWGVLGDQLAARLNVPILFINTAYGATTVANWLESARGQRAQNIYCASCGEEGYYPTGMPYANLRIALNSYVSQYGMRAVLWHQGESDNQMSTSAGTYANTLRDLISHARNQTGGKRLAWVVARATYLNTRGSWQPVIDGQNSVVNPGDNVFGGPFTDNIQTPRPDGVHFSGDGHRQHAQAWFDALANSSFFNDSQPQSPTPPPAIGVNCNGANSLSFNLPGGFNSYVWNNAGNGQVGGGTSITGSSGATFYPLVKDGFSNTFWGQPVSVPSTTLAAAPSINAESALTVCVGGSARLSSTGRDDDLWSTGTVARTITPTQPGSYTVRTRGVYGCYSDPSGAVSFSNFPPPPSAPSVSASGPIQFCPENNVTLSASSGAGYEWSNGSRDQRITTNQAGAFSVKVFDGNGCASASSSPVEIRLFATPSTPVISTNTDPTFCEGGEVTLTASSGSVYQWSNGSTTPGVNTRISGKFSLTVKDGNGCQSPRSDEKVVTVNALPPKPTITPQSNNTFCAGGNVVLSASNPPAQPATFRWNVGNQPKDLNVTRSGTFRLIVTDANGCSSRDSSDAVTVTVNSLPSAPRIEAGGATTFCPENNVMLTSTDALGYRWSNNATDRAVRINQAGRYTARVSDANGCFSPPSNSIDIRLFATPPAPVISPSSPTTFCDGGQVKLTSSTANVYQWNNGSTAPSVDTRVSGKFSLTIKDGNGCISPVSGQTVVTVNALPPKPTLSANGSTTVCDGVTVLLTAADPPVLPAVFLWNNGSRDRSVPVTRTGAFRLLITDGNGCTSNDSSELQRVTVNPNPPQPSITASGPTTFCADQSVTFSASTDVAYRWNTGATTRAIASNVTNRYTVQVINQYDCISLPSAEVSTKVNPLPPAPRILAEGFTTFCDGDSVRLRSDSPLQTTWNLTTDATPLTVARKTGDFFAKVTDANGCVSLASNAIAVDAKTLPSTPIIERAGAYTLEATGVVAGDDYAWQRDGANLNPRTQVIKAGRAGSYGVRSRLTYAVPAPINRLTCYSKPSTAFRLAFDPGDSGLSVYPNPSQGMLTLETREDLPNATVTVFSLDGRVIFSDLVPRFDERKRLDLRTTPGLYLLRVQAGDFQQLKRIRIDP